MWDDSLQENVPNLWKFLSHGWFEIALEGFHIAKTEFQVVVSGVQHVGLDAKIARSSFLDASHVDFITPSDRHKAERKE